ncbi:sulfite oxidase [Desulfosediminicola flagellatus]|uniref:sulfite oxidase n=1 Tax=Desulfosediminicola flagellatus TaxID=2569541 RepID=UPI0010AD0903|nr:sulfite oxidase [Desulfosediminicola flagellatus]
MEKKMRVMTEKPLNAETPVESLRSWITANSIFFDRNQGMFPSEPISLEKWKLSVDGEIENPFHLTMDQILKMTKVIVANTFECSGNGRSLLKEKARGNTWTIGGVGNAVYGGIWLKDVLQQAGLKSSAKHVSFEGDDQSPGSAGIKFIRSLPIEKAMSTTLLAYEMNGEALPLKHGYPLRVLALGWTGANCVKWLSKINVLDRPYEGFFMDNVYRTYQKGEESKSGEVVTEITLKSFITQPLNEEELSAGTVVILGTAYAGETDVDRVEVSLDNGKNWADADFIGPHEKFAWRHWQYIWEAKEKGDFTLMSRAIDSDGNPQPMNADWNVLGYGNNGVEEHAITVHIR